MIIPKEVQCRTCDQVFCCAKCRQRHEDGSHQEATMIRKICYICNNRPFPLRRDTKITPNNLLIVHILKDHLPLRCNRCAKVFYTLEDFKNVNKCFMVCAGNEPGKESECHLESSKPICAEPVTQADEVENKENFPSTQTLADDDGGIRHQPPNASGRRKSSILPGDLQPFADPENKIEEVDEALLTPLTKINLRWKRKSRQSFDSILSVTNNTSEANASGMLRVDAPGGGGPAGNRRKLVRTTSTPMYQWQIMPSIMALKHPNESYSATLGQMSSIHCSSGSETDSRTEELESPPQPQPVPPPPPPPSGMPDELNKVRAAIIRTNRSKAAATPLRQVMSKSIQRAIAQHTGAYSKMLLPGTQRKMSFNSTMSSGVNSMIASPVRDPLDLRTTPVLKRRGGSVTSNGTDRSQETRRENSVRLLTQTASVDGGRMRLFQESKSSANNSSEPSEYYETHRDMDTLWSSTEDEPAERENHNNFRKQADYEPTFPRTPKQASVKKTINFDEQSSKHDLTQEKSIEGDDVWGTPSSTLPVRSFSCSAVGLGDTFKAYDASVEETDEQDSTLDEVFYPPPRSSKLSAMEVKEQRKKNTPKAVGAGKTQNGGRLWSIVSNVIRLASRGDVQEELAAGGRANVEVSQATAGTGGGLVQRAVSFADYLKSRYKGSDGAGSSVRTSSSGSDEYRILSGTSGKKRRRAATTVYSRTFAPATMAVPKVQCNSPVAKRKRIQARQPIQRLRNTSSGSGSSSNGMIG
ncbi:AGAP003740-PA-like protein [Anopheles sinensis]|uniref:AGAP003740-PA-like protein n=1 Tax=Anopheles sinensis TaxID=74873 RepID=A0A084VZP1_ANOSI|nr:AGAP003740-PA-like protein [Anopheles sinensis]